VQLQAVDTGFHADHLITATINLPQSEYGRPDQWLTFNNELLERIKTLPGVEGAALGVGVPFLQPPFAVPFSIEGRSAIRPGERTSVALVEASPDYFDVMRIPLHQGRAFAGSDVRQSQRVAIVNRAFVRQYFGEEVPIGRTVGLGDPNPIHLQVVGVVADTVQSSVVAAPPALMYLPFAQRPFWITSFVVRASVGTDSIASAFRREVFRLAPTVPVLAVDSMEESITRSFAASRYRTLLLTMLGALALILAIVGIHGIVSYSVARRTHEIGVRMALGAQPHLVLRAVIAQGFRLALAGIALGLLITIVVSRFLATLLFRVSATDPFTLVGVALLVLIVALAACFVPARRATKVDPLVALRFE
jgi:putative ABC transport system permease protein